MRDLGRNGTDTACGRRDGPASLKDAKVMSNVLTVDEGVGNEIESCR